MFAAGRDVKVVRFAVNLPRLILKDRIFEPGSEANKVVRPSGDRAPATAPACYETLEVGGKVVTLDFQDSPGTAEFVAMMMAAVVLITLSLRAVLFRLDLVFDDLAKKDARVIQLPMIGPASPHGDRAGHDLTRQAFTERGLDERMPIVPCGDLAAAERTVLVELAEFFTGRRRGGGTYQEVSILEVCEALARPVEYGLTLLSGVLGGGREANGIYPPAIGSVARAALAMCFEKRTWELHSAHGAREELQGVLQRTPQLNRPPVAKARTILSRRYDKALTVASLTS